MERVTLFRLALLGVVWFAACGQVASDPDPTTPSKVLDPQPQVPGDGVVSAGATATVGVNATSSGVSAGNDSGAIGTATTGSFFGVSASTSGGSGGTSSGGAGGSDGNNNGSGGNGALGGQAGQAGERGEGGEHTTP